MATQTGPPFLGRPVLSSERCRGCGTSLLGVPYWVAESNDSGWIGFSLVCAYECLAQPSHLRLVREVQVEKSGR